MKRSFASLLRASPASPVATLVERARDPSYWADLADRHALDDTSGSRDAPPASATSLRDDWRAALCEEGYITVAPCIDEAPLDRALSRIQLVQDAGWPAIFAFVYDETWQLVQHPSFHAVITELLGPGYRQLPGIWVHEVKAIAGARGFGPHIDAPGPAYRMSDGMPDRLTVWLPLVDVTLDNACIFVVPADAVCTTWVQNFAAHRSVDFARMCELLQAARPLPVCRGGLLAWRFDVVHWGGVHRGPGAPARTAISLEYLHTEAAPKLHEGFSLDPQEIPSFAMRLQLIARSLLAYGKAAERDPDAAQCIGLAERLYRPTLP